MTVPLRDRPDGLRHLTDRLRPLADRRQTADRLRQLGRRGVLFDVALALGVTGVGMVNLWLLLGPLADIYRKLGAPQTYSPTLSIACMLAMTVPLALRRAYPATTLLVVTAGSAVLALERVPEYFATSMASLIAIYTVGAYATPRRALATRLIAVIAAAGLTVYLLSTVDYSYLTDLDGEELVLFAWFSNGTNLVVTVVAIAIAWMLGDVVRRLRDRQAELAARTAQLARANETIAQQAVAAERLRIARELHDVVAHHVSVMGLQAGAARRVLDRDRDAAAQALRVVEDTGRQAVDELARLLGMLRSSAPDDGHPQPTMAELIRLVERMRQTGLDVRVRTIGRPPPLPTGVELSIYRVVQEALTNALKHAGSRARVDVELEYSASQVQLAVRSRGASGAAPAPAGTTGNGPTGNVLTGNGTVGNGTVGRGLIGMRERIGMHGGHLRAGTLEDGRFEVLATIPV